MDKPNKKLSEQLTDEYRLDLLKQTGRELGNRLTELEAANNQIRKARHAALNIMEDAILSRDALLRSEKRLHLALEAAKMGTFVYYVQEDRTEADEQMLALFGLQPNEKLSLAVALAKLVHPDDRQRYADEVRQALNPAGNKRLNSDIRIIHPDGSVHWVNVTAQVEFEGHPPEAVKMTGVCIDITERKQSEEALRESEERLRLATAAADIYSWEYNLASGTYSFSDNATAILGRSRLPKTPDDNRRLVHPDDAPLLQKTLDGALASGKGFTVEFRSVKDDGSVVWLSVQTTMVTDDNGKALRLIGIAQDISKRKEAEEALRTSETKLRITMESATDYAIITMDTERRIERWSSGAAQIFGYTEEEVLGQSADLIFTEEDRAAGAPQKEMETARDCGRAADERWHRRKDGSRFYMSGFMRPIYNGHLTGYVKVARDATQQKLFTEELSRLVAERTLALQQSNESLQQFATIAAHDLQEPLRKLRLFASVLQRFSQHLPPEGRELLAKIDATSGRMSRLIGEVLQYSRIAYGTKEWVPANLDEILLNVLNDLELQLEETGATVVYERALPEIEAVPPQMNQLFYNLLSNALKFRREEVAPVIRISAVPLPPDKVRTYPGLPENKHYIEIRFADNGIGFDEEFSEQIFQIFERLHSVDEFEGTGVGLALCKKIVENHHGHILATSKKGEGASFVIVLPLNQ